jgi:predicted nuclease of predicted toxin-antitoxin system
VKLLLDMNIPPSVALALRSAGFTAVHWSDIGDHRAQDATLLLWAHDNGHVVVTHDLDFAALLAAGGQGSPSVIQLRTRDLRPDRYTPLLIDALSQSRDALDAGALVTVSEAESRIRILPLRPT